MMVPSEQPPASPRRATIMIILLILILLLTTRTTVILILRLRRWSTDSYSFSEEELEIIHRFYSFYFPK